MWAVESIESGIELLTGIGAGEWSEDGGWAEGSVFGRCQERLNEMVRLMRQSGKGRLAPDEGENEVCMSDEGDQNHDDDDDNGDRAHTS